MKRPGQLISCTLLAFTLLVVVPGCATSPTAPLNAISSGNELQLDENALIVVIEDPRSDRQRSNLSGPAYNTRLAYNEDPILNRYASHIARDYELNIVDEWPLKSLGVHCFVINPDSSLNVNELQKDKRVLWVQPFNEFALKSGEPSHSTSSAYLKNRFTEEFNARGRSIRVAVIDTAVDREHPDFHHSSLKVQNFSGSRGQPDSELHGTAVVGLIAANPQTAQGVRGIAPEARTHLLRGCWQDQDRKGRCNTLTLALALDAAVELKPDILNLSLSGARDRILEALIARLTEQGTLVIAAYDEHRSDAARFPAPRTGVVYAYGYEQKENQLPQSDHILIAPKQAISLAPMAGYDLISGHSIAAPQLAAMAAVLMETYSNDRREETIERLNRWLDEHVMLQ